MIFEITKRPCFECELPPRCKWDSSTKNTFMEALKSNDMKHKFEVELQQNNILPETGITELSSVLLECAGCSSPDTGTAHEPKPHRKRTTNDKPWYDKECRSTKKEINALGSKLRRYPEDASLREKLFHAKRTSNDYCGPAIF